MPRGRAVLLRLQPNRPAQGPAPGLALGWLRGQRGVRLPLRQGVRGCQGEGEELRERFGGAGSHADEPAEQRGWPQGKRSAGAPFTFALCTTGYQIPWGLDGG